MVRGSGSALPRPTGRVVRGRGSALLRLTNLTASPQRRRQPLALGLEPQVGSRDAAPRRGRPAGERTEAPVGGRSSSL